MIISTISLVPWLETNKVLYLTRQGIGDQRSQEGWKAKLGLMRRASVPKFVVHSNYA